MLLIRNIGQLATAAGGSGPLSGVCQGELGLIERAAVLVDGDRIAAAGPEADILRDLR